MSGGSQPSLQNVEKKCKDKSLVIAGGIVIADFSIKNYFGEGRFSDQGSVNNLVNYL